jgi:hypothetical protein
MVYQGHHKVTQCFCLSNAKNGVAIENEGGSEWIRVKCEIKSSIQVWTVYLHKNRGMKWAVGLTIQEHGVEISGGNVNLGDRTK